MRDALFTVDLSASFDHRIVDGYDWAQLVQAQKNKLENPGGANLEIFDVLPRYDIRCIRTEHEQGAVHAAQGYARANRPGGGVPSH